MPESESRRVAQRKHYLSMGLYDHYEPADICCPSCDEPFAGWTGRDGPCKFFVFRFEGREPVDQRVGADVRSSESEWRAVHLPPRFLITAKAHGHGAHATGVCDERGTWIATFLHHNSWTGCGG